MWSLVQRIWRAGVATEPPGQLLSPAPAAFRGVPRVDAGRCEGAGACVAACPTGALTLVPDGSGRSGRSGRPAWTLDPQRCHFCGICTDACPHQALTDAGEYALATLEDAGAALARRVREVLGRSLHIRHLDSGSCNGCDWELSALLGPVYDVQRFGMDFVASPRHADVLLATGGVTAHLEQALRLAWEAMGDPKAVVAVGSCALGGGIAGATYAHHGGVSKVVPVAVCIPGCPPRPQAIVHGLMLALDRLADLRA